MASPCRPLSKRYWCRLIDCEASGLSLVPKIKYEHLLLEDEGYTRQVKKTYNNAVKLIMSIGPQ